MESVITTLMMAALASVVLVAVWWDLRERRVPNVLTLTGLALALGLRVLGGFDPLVSGLFGAGLGLLLGLPLVALGGLGGGDAKLMATVGAFLGPGQLLWALTVTAIVGGIMALVLAFHRGAVQAVFLDAARLVARPLGLAPHRPRRTIESPDAITIPYAVPIAIGALVIVLLT